jgi:hypothetical protein
MKKIAILLLFLFGPISPLLCCTSNPQQRARRMAEQRRRAQEDAVLELRREELRLAHEKLALERERLAPRRFEPAREWHEESRENPTLNRLVEENSNLQKKLVEMQACIALLSIKEKTPVAVADAPPSYETYEEVSAPGPSAPYEDAPSGYPIYEKK